MSSTDMSADVVVDIPERFVGMGIETKNGDVVYRYLGESQVV